MFPLAVQTHLKIICFAGLERKFVFLNQLTTLGFKGLEYYLSRSITKPANSHPYLVKTDQPVQPHSLVRVLAESSMGSQGSRLIHADRKYWLCCTTVQAELCRLISLCCIHVFFVDFVILQLVLYSTPFNLKKKSFNLSSFHYHDHLLVFWTFFSKTNACLL